MSENFSKSQLEQMRVADLKNIAENYSIDTSGMKKSDLVESILDVDEEDKQSEVSVEFDNKAANDNTKASYSDENSENSDDQKIESTLGEDALEEADKDCNPSIPDVLETRKHKNDNVTQVHKDTKVIIKNGIVPLYHDKNCTKILARVSGKLFVLSDFEFSTKVRGFVSGYGPIVGFIRK